MVLQLTAKSCQSGLDILTRGSFLWAFSSVSHALNGSLKKCSAASPNAQVCGRGDNTTEKGKIFNASYGRTAFLGRRTKGSLSNSLGWWTNQRADLRQEPKDRNCRASLENDAPFALAIGACILSTLVIPNDEEDDGQKENDLFGLDDMRSGAMQGQAWIFAWLDSGKQRYLAFAILDLSVSGEGSNPPLIDISKLTLEKSQLKDLRVRPEGLMCRLKEVAERTDIRKVDKFIEEDVKTTATEWKAIQEQKERDDLKEFDERLAKSLASLEGVEDAPEEMERVPSVSFRKDVY